MALLQLDMILIPLQVTMIKSNISYLNILYSLFSHIEFRINKGIKIRDASKHLFAFASGSG